MPAARLGVVLATSMLLPPGSTPTPPSGRLQGRHVLPAAVPDPSLRVTFDISTCFWDPPPAGMLPLQLVVGNAGTRAREWTLAFEATSGYHRYGTSYSTTHVVNAPAGTQRVFELAVPVRAAPSKAGLASSLQVTFDGPKTPYDAVSLYSNNYYLHSGTGHAAHSPWIGLSEPLAAAHWEPAKALLGTRDSTMLVGSRFDPVCLPADWRAYTGFAALGLTGDEWHDLAPAARLGIERWVARGGVLWLADGRVGERRALGFGHTLGLPAPDELGATALADAVVALRAAAVDYWTWPLVSEMGTPPLPRGLMLACITGFAFLVGPVNLFGFCRGANRHRVFWTTPLISAAAAAGLVSVIVLRDGTGGHGRRLTVVGLLPDRHEEVVLQEQLARTGLLLGGRFTASEPVWLETLETTDNSGWGRSADLRRDGDVFSGSWFVSRALQGQWIEAVRPSRARFEVEPRRDGPPRLVSTVPDTLDHVWVTDQGGVWHAAGVTPGRAVDLVRSDPAALERWWTALTTPYGPRLKQRTGLEPPLVLAAAARSRAAVSTLASIDWRDHDTLYVQRPGR